MLFLPAPLFGLHPRKSTFINKKKGGRHAWMNPAAWQSRVGAETFRDMLLPGMGWEAGPWDHYTCLVTATLGVPTHCPRGNCPSEEGD